MYSNDSSNYKNIFFLLLSHRFSPLCSRRQTASRFAIRNCNSIEYLWALPTPTTFEKVDQTFTFGTEKFSFAVLCCPTESWLNHNSPTITKGLNIIINKNSPQFILRTVSACRKSPAYAGLFAIFVV